MGSNANGTITIFRWQRPWAHSDKLVVAEEAKGKGLLSVCVLRGSVCIAIELHSSLLIRYYCHAMIGLMTRKISSILVCVCAGKLICTCQAYMTKQWHLPFSFSAICAHIGSAWHCLYSLLRPLCSSVCFCNLISFPLLYFAAIYTLKTYATATLA